MQSEDELYARIEAAMGRIRAAIRDDAEVEHEGEAIPLYRKARRLSRSNEQLRHEMALLRARREKDIAEIDELVGQLKPLIGGA